MTGFTCNTVTVVDASVVIIAGIVRNGAAVAKACIGMPAGPPLNAAGVTTTTPITRTVLIAGRN